MKEYPRNFVLPEYYILHTVRLFRHIVMQVHTYVYLAVVRTVCLVVQILLVEEVISSVSHPLGYTFPLIIQRLRRVTHSSFYQVTAGVVGHIEQHRILQIYRIVANRIFGSRMHIVRQPYFPLFLFYRCIYRGLEISLVTHRFLYLLHTLCGLQTVIDNRRLAYLVRILCRPLVVRSECIRRCCVVQVQLQFPESQHLRVLCLTQVMTQLRCRNLVRSIYIHVDLVQQLLVFRHKLRHITTAQQYSCKKYHTQNNMFSAPLLHNSHNSAYKDTKLFAYFQIFLYLCIKFV